MSKHSHQRPLFEAQLLRDATVNAAKKLHPEQLARNPVMFAVGVCSAISTIITFREAYWGLPFSFSLQISLWLWFTVFFGNFAEAIAEGRGIAIAEA